jgi:hypothetical protein
MFEKIGFFLGYYLIAGNATDYYEKVPYFIIK